jgi:hypothetical protein
MSFLTQRADGALVAEDTNGTFKQAIQADKTYPFGYDVVTTENNITEGFRAANGKISEPRYFRGAVTAATTLHSYMTESADPTSATGTFVFGDLLAMCGFREDTGDTNIKYIWDGQTNCQTMSGTFVNLGCGTSTTGAGYDLRGMRGNFQLTAEETGKPFMIDIPVMAAVEDYDQAKSAIGGDFTLEDSAVELFEGALTFDSVLTNVETISIDLAATQKTGKTPAAGKNGVSLIKTTDNRPKVTITAPVGSDTATWWDNMINGNVIAELTYVGTYYDITITNMSISGHTQEDSDGEIALTQELGFDSITIEAK